MGLALEIIGSLLGLVVLLGLTAWVVGLVIRKRGQRPFDAEALEAEGGKFALNSEGRHIAYVVYGSTDPSAPVVVNMHGSGAEANFEKELWAPICEDLGVRGIALSLPGYGHTDMLPGRVVKDWPREDLEPVLAQEGVEQFMITGHSQGNPHAMAAALHFPSRCIGLGLNAPLLPSDLSEEVGVKGALGMGSLLRTKQLKKTAMAWYFAVYHLGVVTLSPWIVLKAIPQARKDSALAEALARTLNRAVVRGSFGGSWESTEDICYEWKIDPRRIQTRNVCIWHAIDDKECPGEIGEWLAKMFRAKPGVHVDYRADDVGFGHFTYCRGEYLKPESSMIKVMLDGLRVVQASATPKSGG